MTHKRGTRAGIAALVGIAMVVGFSSMARPSGASAPLRPQELDEETLALAKGVYEAQCMSCHGPEGRGDGPAARFLETQPRDFTTGEWKYLEEPTTEEVVRLVREGIDDSGMTPFEEVLTENEMQAVARYVLEVLAKGEGGGSRPALDRMASVRGQ